MYRCVYIILNVYEAYNGFGSHSVNISLTGRCNSDPDFLNVFSSPVAVKKKLPVVTLSHFSVHGRSSTFLFSSLPAAQKGSAADVDDDPHRPVYRVIVGCL